jgi:hypothetical protein
VRSMEVGLWVDVSSVDVVRLKQRFTIYSLKSWVVLLVTRQTCVSRVINKFMHYYTNKEIATRLTTLRELREDEKLSSFIKWIRKQPPTKIMKNRKSNGRKMKKK